MKWIVTLSIIAFSLVSFGQQTAGKPMRILLENATVHVGNGQVFEKGLVGIEGQQIILVRNALAYTYRKEEWDTILNLDGQHIYPGFVAPNTTLGLTEIEAIRASNDFNEVGTFNPHVRSLIAYNCESAILATVRTNGILLTQSTPRGGIISGTSSVMATSCWNWEDGVVKSDDGVHVNWPASLQSGGWWNESAPVKRNEKYEEQKRTVYDFFTQAQAYKKANESSIDLRFEAMKTCFTGTKRVYFHANELQQILDIIDLVGLFDLKNAVIIGGYDAYLAADKLKEKNIAIMLPRLHSLPMNDDDAVDLVYQLPFLLQQKGVRFCLQNEGDMEAMNARNLPFLAGTAWAYGLSEEEAIRSISLSTCEILGIADAYGSIEEGKKASIYVSFGNALDMRTNQASVIIVNGIFIPTSNFQTELYLKYKQKLGIK